MTGHSEILSNLTPTCFTSLYITAIYLRIFIIYFWLCFTYAEVPVNQNTKGTSVFTSPLYDRNCKTLKLDTPYRKSQNAIHYINNYIYKKTEQLCQGAVPLTS